MTKQNINFLSLTKDRFFKAFFEKREDFLISLAESFLPLPKGSVIESVSILNPELHPTQSSKAYKLFVLDLRVKLRRRINGLLQDTEIVNLEVQTTAHRNFTDRLLAYSSRLYSDQLKEGEDFNKLLPVYCLVFTTVNLKEFKQIKDYYHVCNIRRTQAPEVVMSKGMCFVIVELDKFRKSLNELFDKKEDWCYLLKNSNNLDQQEYSSFQQKGGVMAEAAKHLWTLSQDETLQEIAIMEKRARMDQKAIKRDAYEDGLQEGRQEGLREGRQEGLQEGRQEGLQEGRQEIISQLLRANMNVQKVREITHLSEQEILKIKSKLSL